MQYGQTCILEGSLCGSNAGNELTVTGTQKTHWEGSTGVQAGKRTEDLGQCSLTSVSTAITWETQPACSCLNPGIGGSI